MQSADRADDGMRSQRERAEPVIARAGRDADAFMREACAEWYDARAFGQPFAFKSKGIDGVSMGIRGPVSICPAFSVTLVDITSTRITKSVNSETSDKKSSDTMGMRHRVDSAMHVLRGSINPQLAIRTGFSEEDAELLKEALRTLFVNDVSSARPDSSMRVAEFVWWRHSCAGGQYPAARIHDSFRVVPKNDNPKGLADYDVVIEKLEGLEPEVIEGLRGCVSGMLRSVEREY